MSDVITDMARTERELRRGVARERRLCCPRCGCQVMLQDGRLWCIDSTYSCAWSGERLAELAEAT